MKVEDRKGEANVAYRITDIEGDMGESTRMELILQADGDVILGLLDTKDGQALSIEFCSGLGGGRNPQFTNKLRELVMLLVGQAQ